MFADGAYFSLMLASVSHSKEGLIILACSAVARVRRKNKYCSLLKRMQLTFITWVKSFNPREDGWGGGEGRGGGNIDLVKIMSFYHCMTFCPLVAI